MEGKPKDRQLLSVWANLDKLLPLTQPKKVFGVLYLHACGVLLTSCSTTEDTRRICWGKFRHAFFHPGMVPVLVLMIVGLPGTLAVNDYFDAKFGRDDNRIDKPLGLRRRHRHRDAAADSENTITDLDLVRRFVSYIYSVALICVLFLPGNGTRALALIGLWITYVYTEYFKPRPWFKNLACAGCIAFVPVTSASATLSLLTRRRPSSSSWISYMRSFTKLWYLAGVLFFGHFAREVMRDLRDYDSDLRAGIATVPVTYGKEFASLVGSGSLAIASCLALLLPSRLLVLKRVGTATAMAMLFVGLGAATAACCVLDLFTRSNSGKANEDAIVVRSDERAIVALFFLTIACLLVGK